MAKKNKNIKNAPSNNVNIVLPDSLSAEEMQQIITNALLDVEDAIITKLLKFFERFFGIG